MTNRIMHAPRLTATLALAALLLAGCSTGGVPQPASSSPHPSTTATTATSALAALDPCTLITNQEATTVHLTLNGPHKAVIGTGRACRWTATSADVGIRNGYVIDIEIQPARGLNDYNTAGFQLQSMTYKNHKAEQFASQGACDETIIITGSSTVIVTAVAEFTNPCTLANDFATLIDPKLP